ncbi:MAG: hypothetical protein J3Q66DRAFT_43457 [Benniella sp.]|nr:MAG: hypothetical protein J3Q66DRAFT_43457 [Benniella sp.]
MRAKYVKKLWYRDPNGNQAPESQTSSHSPSVSGSFSSMGGSNIALAVPERVQTTKSQSVDSMHSSSTAPERTLSRKSSTISSDSGSTTLSKSTNLSSATSSPFNAGSKNPNQQQYQQQQYQQQQYQQQQYQQQQQPQSQVSFDDFARLMNVGNTSEGYTQGLNPSLLGTQAFVSTPAAIDNSDPFSSMTNAFGNMGMDSHQNMATMASGAGAVSNAQLPFQQQPSMSSSNDFFASFSTGAGSTSGYTTNAMDNNDPFSMSRPTMQHPVQTHLTGNSLNSLDFSGNSLAPSAGGMSGAKSFDNYLQALGGRNRSPSQPLPAHHLQSSSGLSAGNFYNTLSTRSPSSGPSSVAALSPQSTGGSSNPFSKPQPPQPQLLSTDFSQLSTASPSPSSASSQPGNPFALFAKQTMAPPNHLSAPLTDPFGRGLTMGSQQQQQQQHQDYFSTVGPMPSAARSINPFGLGTGTQSPFDQQQQQQQQQLQQSQLAFGGSGSESSYSFQNAFGNSGNVSHLNGAVNNNNNNNNNNNTSFESAFSVPGAVAAATAPRSMTLPPTGAANSSLNDMFGQWIKPSPMSVSSKYPSIDGLDPFSTSASGLPNASAPSSTTNIPVGTSAFSNPFSSH